MLLQNFIISTTNKQTNTSKQTQANKHKQTNKQKKEMNSKTIQFDKNDNVVDNDHIFIKMTVRGDEDDDEEEEEADDEYSRKRNLSEILSKHNIDDVLKEKILDDYFLSTIDMLVIQKAIKMKNLENKMTRCDDEDEDEEENEFDDEDEFVDEDFDEDHDEDEYIRQRHERIDRKHNLSGILSKHNIDDAVLVEKLMSDYVVSMLKW